MNCLRWQTAGCATVNTTRRRSRYAEAPHTQKGRTRRKGSVRKRVRSPWLSSGALNPMVPTTALAVSPTLLPEQPSSPQPEEPLQWGLSHGWSSGRGFRCVWMGARRFWFRVQVAASRCRWILSRLWTVQTSRHSLDVASSPLFENRRNLRLALMFPKTVSTVVLRLA